MQITFWGTRGSIASPGPATLRYGGNTSCVQILTDNGTLLICDSGTGIRELGLNLLARSSSVHGHVLLSHTHWDHIQGWPFFTPALSEGNEFTIHGASGSNCSLEQALANQMENTYFPITLDAMGAGISVEDEKEGEFTVEGVRVTVHYLNHTTVCLGYRIEADGKTVVYASDHEAHGLPLSKAAPPPMDGAVTEPRMFHKGDQQFAEFVEKADLLILDSQYTDEEYLEKVGWGHSTPSFAVDVAVLARVQRLALFHHDPARGDEAVDQMVESARRRAGSYGADLKIFGAAERQTVVL